MSKTINRNTSATEVGTAPVLEVAILQIVPDQTEAFEAAFATAALIIARMPGYISHELQQCIEHDRQYILLVRWRSLEDHTIGFRGSPEYQEWRALLHHFYDPFPTVEHYRGIASPDRKYTVPEAEG